MKRRALRTWTKVDGTVARKEFCFIDTNKCNPKPEGTNKAELRRAAKAAAKA